LIPQNSLPKIDPIIGEMVQHLSIAPHIRAIILIGSYSRGDTNEYSDIDLVLITDLFLPRSKFYAILPSELNIKELSLLPYPLEIFTKLYMEGSLFIAHVLKEGLVLYDEGCYANLRRISFKVTRESLLLQWKMLKQRVRLYDNLSMFGEVFVDCLSHMYSIMKNAAIITLAMNGEMFCDSPESYDKKVIIAPASA